MVSQLHSAAERAGVTKYAPRSEAAPVPAASPLVSENLPHHGFILGDQDLHAVQRSSSGPGVDVEARCIFQRSHKLQTIHIFLNGRSVEPALGLLLLKDAAVETGARSGQSGAVSAVGEGPMSVVGLGSPPLSATASGSSGTRVTWV